MKNQQLMTMAIAIVMTIGVDVIAPNALASHSVSPTACYSDGVDAGEDGESSDEMYEFCEQYGDEYYDGFIDGCMSADNSRGVCEQATDS
jgi:hypothetical protein